MITIILLSFSYIFPSISGFIHSFVARTCRIHKIEIGVKSGFWCSVGVLQPSPKTIIGVEITFVGHDARQLITIGKFIVIFSFCIVMIARPILEDECREVGFTSRIIRKS